jgi:hypothetical protein
LIKRDEFSDGGVGYDDGGDEDDNDVDGKDVDDNNNDFFIDNDFNDTIGHADKAVISQFEY